MQIIGFDKETNKAVVVMTTDEIQRVNDALMTHEFNPTVDDKDKDAVFYNVRERFLTVYSLLTQGGLESLDAEEVLRLLNAKDALSGGDDGRNLIVEKLL